MLHNHMIQETARVTGQLSPLPTRLIVNLAHLYQLRLPCVPKRSIICACINIINDGKHDLQVTKHMFITSLTLMSLKDGDQSLPNIIISIQTN
ncbi:hypothetical protein E2C01_028697 [Portunus trituberculatus]|uniref:Uncharacterized protein n=1 Tax=Portunus trituberculatus TaxID=210409 RepID=A0A5B7EPS5_PORTR|nr:hypothetical protein [Portunus trituberculatus]